MLKEPEFAALVWWRLRDGSVLGSCASARYRHARKFAAQPLERPELSIELIDPKTFRVCADPNNMPFSTERGEGFENKLAELLAAQLGKGVAYSWYPQAPGFVRNTLAAHKCDVLMGIPQGDDVVQVTNPYYRTAYALVFKQRNGKPTFGHRRSADIRDCEGNRSARLSNRHHRKCDLNGADFDYGSLKSRSRQAHNLGPNGIRDNECPGDLTDCIRRKHNADGAARMCSERAPASI